MLDETREADTVVRIGGDEFVVILNRLVDPKRLARLADTLISRIAEPIGYGADTCRISASIGIVLSTDAEPLAAARLHYFADLALYEAKRAGRSAHRFFDPSMCLSGALDEVGHAEPGCRRDTSRR